MFNWFKIFSVGQLIIHVLENLVMGNTSSVIPFTWKGMSFEVTVKRVV